MQITINERFRQRIGYPLHKVISFAHLQQLLSLAAERIPFENVQIIHKQTAPLTKASILHKIVDRNEGGLCYELNTALYYFLQENDFDVSLIRAIIYDGQTQTWSPSGYTHVAILLKMETELYLIDTGFGNNLPLTPVPLSGETVTSTNGSFKIVNEQELYMKRTNRDTDWVLAYRFDKQQMINDETLNTIQDVIVNSPASPFNKGLLLTKCTPNGTVTLTQNSFTTLIDGQKSHMDITPEDCEALAIKHFNRSLRQP